MTPLELRISEAVTSSKLTYTEIARRANVERTAVGKWAKTGKITVNNFVKLCQVIDIDPMSVLFGKEYEEFSSQNLQGVRNSQRLLIEKILELDSNDDDSLTLLYQLLIKMTS
ncbi:XRE family transcriptional regulator [Vibrio parahaemolyticus]|uniref:XRE family transcriptional regulator n=1 Tax=Vibrio parahaemolyticus TaxID=670 RepID=UPI0011EE6692|nr:XRE family transcriptional regulator [Vibrio parahaemolyticus]KAB5597898.1 XRE family transcriptional regulator [Vibrio parahaemolyticus]